MASIPSPSTGQFSAGPDRPAPVLYARRWQALGVLALSLILIGLDNTILNVALPTFVDQLHATNSQLQWILDAYTLVFAGLLLTAGSLGDRFGRKGMLNLGLLVFVLGSIASANTTSARQLIVTRAIMGGGGAFIMPSTLSILTNIFPEHERGRAIGIWAGAAGVGIPLGPLLGGWLLDHAHWSAVFYINVPLVIAALALGAWLLPTSRDPNPRRIDVPGGVLSIAGISSLVYGIIEAPRVGWTDATTVTWIVVGVVLVAVFAWWEYRTFQPMLDVRFFRSARFSAANAAIVLVFFALFGGLLSLTQYLQFILGYSPFQAGVRMLPVAVGLMFGAPASARIVEHIGSKAVVAGGLVIVAVGMLLLSRLEVDSSYPTVAIAFVVMSTGMGFTMAPATEAVMGAIPRSRAGVGSAMNDTTRQLGGALGVAIMGSLMASVYQDHIATAVTALPAGLVAAAEDSLGAAMQVASSLGPAGRPLVAAAQRAFVDGMQLSLLAGSGVALLGALVAVVFLPARGVAVGEDFDAEGDEV